MDLPRVIAFDGDDTLWHSETIFSVTHDRMHGLLAPYCAPSVLDERLLATERRNLRYFGYGVKGFVLSMVETAIEVSEGRVTAGEVAAILDAGKAMLDHPVELLEGAREALEALAGERRLVLVTKGDLFDQESKLARSGLGELFERVEVVAEKDERAYRRVLSAVGVAPPSFAMVGNSVRSDVLPVLGLGARAVHVPYPITWALEDAEPGPAAGRYEVLDDLRGLPAALARLDGT
jgi:putative hydrolase of the HAD superfamily